MRLAALLLILAIPAAAKDKPEDLVMAFVAYAGDDASRNGALDKLHQEKPTAVLGAIKKVQSKIGERSNGKEGDPVRLAQLLAVLHLANDGWKYLEPFLHNQDGEIGILRELVAGDDLPDGLFDLWMIRDPVGPVGAMLEEAFVGHMDWVSRNATKLGKLLDGKDRPESAARILAPVLGVASGGPLADAQKAWGTAAKLWPLHSAAFSYPSGGGLLDSPDEMRGKPLPRGRNVLFTGDMALELKDTTLASWADKNHDLLMKVCIDTQGWEIFYGAAAAGGGGQFRGWPVRAANGRLFTTGGSEQEYGVTANPAVWHEIRWHVVVKDQKTFAREVTIIIDGQALHTGDLNGSSLFLQVNMNGGRMVFADACILGASGAPKQPTKPRIR